jgi:hypothetical protein
MVVRATSGATVYERGGTECVVILIAANGAAERRHFNEDAWSKIARLGLVWINEYAGFSTHAWLAGRATVARHKYELFCRCRKSSSTMMVRDRGGSHRRLEVPAAQVPLHHGKHSLHRVLNLAQTARAILQFVKNGDPTRERCCLHDARLGMDGILVHTLGSWSRAP